VKYKANFVSFYCCYKNDLNDFPLHFTVRFLLFHYFRLANTRLLPKGRIFNTIYGNSSKLITWSAVWHCSCGLIKVTKLWLMTVIIRSCNFSTPNSANRCINIPCSFLFSLIVHRLLYDLSLRFMLTWQGWRVIGWNCRRGWLEWPACSFRVQLLCSEFEYHY